MVVVKRDGRKAEFDTNKIIEAVQKAFKDVDGELTADAKSKSKEIAQAVVALDRDPISVEEIQDFVETKLMASKRKDVAKAYIIYRNDRTKIREKNMELMKTIKEKLTASNVQNQNANIDEKSFGGRVGEASDAVLKQYALDNCMSCLLYTSKAIKEWTAFTIKTENIFSVQMIWDSCSVY